MKRLIITIITLVVAAFGAATVYDVELFYNDNFLTQDVYQSFLATADSISEVSFFCGRKIIPGTYQFRLYDSAGVQPISAEISSDSAGLFEHELVSATFNPKVYVRKGFMYRVHIKHSRSDLYNTNFYYNCSNPYPDGELIDHSSCDLAARIKGFNNFPTNLFGMNSHLISTKRNPPDEFVAMDKWEACIDSMKNMGVTWDRVGMEC